MSSILNLPPVPPELKAVSPFLARAGDLAKQDPVISYWCAYYAAHLGISINARTTASRDLLKALLGALEKMKSEIGSNDAIDIESVSSAYVENFALKVFTNADNEDRNYRATRATAKKFLAAANFLEVLKTFPKTDVSESNEEKIRYAKWKAADIAKAFREGRKPTPGPPGWAEEQEELKHTIQHEQEEQQIPSSPKFIPSDPSDSIFIPTSTPPHIKSSSPIFISPPKTEDYLRPGRPAWSEAGDQPSENWSTAATPGIEELDMCATAPSTVDYDNDFPTSGSVDSGSSFNTVGSGKGRRNFQLNTRTNEELQTKYTPLSSPTKTSFKSASPDSGEAVLFASSTAGSPPPLPPPPLLGPSSHSKEYICPSSIYVPPQLPISPPSVNYPTHSSLTHPSATSPHALPPSASPPRNHIYAPPPPPSQTSPTQQSGRYGNSLAPPLTPAVEVELTPALIVKAQKHCRFAISSLDYEDAEQARKELRAALALLGG